MRFHAQRGTGNPLTLKQQPEREKSGLTVPGVRFSHVLLPVALARGVGGRIPCRLTNALAGSRNANVGRFSPTRKRKMLINSQTSHVAGHK